MSSIPILIYAPPVSYKSATYSRGDFLLNVGPWANKLEVEHALYGGFWRATWEFDEKTPSHILSSFWDTPFLMYEVVIPGSWEGVVWALEQDWMGESADTTVQDIYNCVRIAYTDKDGNDQAYPSLVTGSDDTSVNAPTLTDSGASFGTLDGAIIKNLTDGSWGVIRTNTGTVVTPYAMVGGTLNVWNNGDQYEIGEYLCDWASIIRFGRRENRLSKSFFDSTTAANNAARILAESAWPIPNISRIGKGDDTQTRQLRVSCSGLVATANNRYLPEATSPPALVDIDARIQTIVDDYCDFLIHIPGSANGVKTPDGVEKDERAWDSIYSLILAGQGNSSVTYCFNVMSGGRAVYHQLTDDGTGHPGVQYYWHGDRWSADGGATLSKWAMRPGVIRNMTISRASRPMGPYVLGDPRDRLPFYVSIKDDEDVPIMATKSDDIRAEIEKNLKWLEDSQKIDQQDL